MRDYAPRPHQVDITRFILEHERCNIWAGMGSGKTVSVLTALDGIYGCVGGYGPTLVLGPLRVVQSVWPEEAALWPHLRGLRVVSVTGTAAERAAALRRDAEVYCINYDNIPWLSDHVRENWLFEIVVADEARRLKSFRLRQGSVRAQRLAQVAHTRVRRWINLTGTPATNGLLDLWGQHWFIDQGVALGRTFGAFEDRWFSYKAHRNADGTTDRFARDLVVADHAKDELESRMAATTITVTNALGVDEPVVNVLHVDLPPEAAKQYRDMERKLFAEFESGTVEAFSAAHKTIKLLQLTNGAIYTTPEAGEAQRTIEVHDAKIQALDSILTEAAGAPVLVAYQWKSDLARLLAAFPQGRALDADPDTVAQWNAGQIPVLFAHPASAGHGLNLQHGGNILAFFGLWWDLELHEQIIERIGPTRQKQSGYNRPVFVHYIAARGTVDDDVIARLRSKATVQQTLLEGMKARASGERR
jgi:SNF2 family DNA or RNA helicase